MLAPPGVHGARGADLRVGLAVGGRVLRDPGKTSSVPLFQLRLVASLCEEETRGSRHLRVPSLDASAVSVLRRLRPPGLRGAPTLRGERRDVAPATRADAFRGDGPGRREPPPRRPRRLAPPTDFVGPGAAGVSAACRAAGSGDARSGFARWRRRAGAFARVARWPTSGWACRAARAGPGRGARNHPGSTQAQGSIGRSGAATSRRATDWSVEQSLEAGIAGKRSSGDAVTRTRGSVSRNPTAGGQGSRRRGAAADTGRSSEGRSVTRRGNGTFVIPAPTPRAVGGDIGDVDGSDRGDAGGPAGRRSGDAATAWRWGRWVGGRSGRAWRHATARRRMTRCPGAGDLARSRPSADPRGSGPEARSAVVTPRRRVEGRAPRTTR